MVRLTEVAARAGVSTATVSLVLSEKDAGRVSATTRDRVLQAAADLDYVGNAAAMSLRTHKTSTVGFLSDVIASTPYAVRMIATANKIAFEAGQLLILVNTEGLPGNERAAVEEFRRHGVDRVIYACMFHREVTLPRGLGGDVVILDGFTEDPRIPSVIPDEWQGARDAVRVLIDAGHRRIAYLGESSREGAAAQIRYESYRHTMAAAGLGTGDELALECPDQIESSDAAAITLLTRARPTAVFCFNDVRASSIYRAASRLGLRIPEDLSVVGFDNLELISERLDPPLTTVQLPHAEMADWAMRQLLEPNEQTTTQEYPVRQSCRLLIRDSVATLSG